MAVRQRLIPTSLDAWLPEGFVVKKKMQGAACNWLKKEEKTHEQKQRLAESR